MTTEQKAKPWWDWKAPAWIVVTLMVYVLSMGPVCKLCFDHHLSGRVLNVYRPIWELSRFAIPGRAMESYLNLWGSRWQAEYWDREHGVIIRWR